MTFVHCEECRICSAQMHKAKLENRWIWGSSDVDDGGGVGGSVDDDDDDDE